MKGTNWKDDFMYRFKHADLPELVFAGATLGFYITGMLTWLFGIFEENMCAEALKSLLCFGLGVINNAIAALYWWLVYRRTGAIEPGLNGFGIILMFLALGSAGVLTIIFDISM
jgi:hypothetical protein